MFVNVLFLFTGILHYLKIKCDLYKIFSQQSDFLFFLKSMVDCYSKYSYALMLHLDSNNSASYQNIHIQTSWQILASTV